MISESQISLSRESMEIEREKRPGTEWLSIKGVAEAHQCELTVFGTAEELDRFIDQIAALRTVES